MKNGEKHFTQCLKWRPLNQYLHYQFALYLYNVVKNKTDAWYHLKIAVNGHQMTSQSKFDSLYHIFLVDKNKNDNDDEYNDMLDVFFRFCKQLYFDCGKTPTCGYTRCTNMIVKTKQNKNLENSDDDKEFKHTCNGCKVKMYCCRKCQKKDWKTRHRNECLVYAVQGLSGQEYQVVNRMKQALDLLSWALVE